MWQSEKMEDVVVDGGWWRWERTRWGCAKRMEIANSEQGILK